MNVSWAEFRERAPGLSEIGRKRMHGRRSYVATVRKNGTPRVAPVSVFTDGSMLWLFVGATSPKRFDLINNGRYALHCEVEDNHGGEGEFHIAGTAVRIKDPEIRERAVAAWPHNPPRDDYLLFELLVETASHTVYESGRAVRAHWNAEE